MNTQKKGIVKTPSHLVELVIEILNIKKDDIALEPCSGSALFLRECSKKGISGVGIEISPVTHIADSHIRFLYTDFLKLDSQTIQEKFKPTVAMINPPYSLGSSKNPELYEINFISHLLDCMVPGGRVAAIVPTSSMTGKTKEIKWYKEEILKKHTLDGVITMNPDSFYGVDTQTVIAIFTAGIPNKKETKFINFQDDGYKITRHKGFLPEENAPEKKAYLLDMWFDKVDVDSCFCIKHYVTAEDEWLHASFYKREEVPEKCYFEKKAEDYFAFRCKSILLGNKHLLEGQAPFSDLDSYDLPELDEKEWKSFELTDVFEIKGTKVIKNLVPNGNVPHICCSSSNNGIDGLYKNSPTEEGNVLTVESAATGSVHYQQVPFTSSSHVEKLILKNHTMNVFMGLFLATALSFEIEGKYSYGYKLSKKRMKQQTVYLPVTRVGEPDYEYMEKYMASIIKCIFDSFISRI